nr:MAG TPA: hypothetical protein [Crassvirales sp.]
MNTTITNYIFMEWKISNINISRMSSNIRYLDDN